MKEKLHAFYHKDFFEVKDKVEIQEIAPQAHACKVTLIGKDLIIINKDFLQSKVFTQAAVFNLESITDEIVIDAKNKVIYLFELKTTIWTGEIRKAQMQLSASYLKLAVYLSLIVDIQAFEVKLFIVGNISNRIKDKDLALKNKKGNGFFLIEKLAREKIYHFPKFPERVYHEINPCYQKQQVAFEHLLPNSFITL